MTRNKKLRLFVTDVCNNKCPMCCNKQFYVNDIPIVDRWDYDEIMITGGEPLLFPNNLERLCNGVRELTNAMGSHPKIYIYTSRCEWVYFDMAIRSYADGFVVAPHSKDDIVFFKETNNKLLRRQYGKYKSCSLRLKVFDEIKNALPENLSVWDVSRAEWIENCPVPKGEDFRRIAELWNKDKW